MKNRKDDRRNKTYTSWKNNLWHKWSDYIIIRYFYKYPRRVEASKVTRVRFTLQVSWMRKRDMHILSAGIFMYTSDLRFQVIHPDKSENWTLQIKSPQERDSGVYECQVSTEPKMSLNYSLNVVGECRLNYSASRLNVNRGLVSILFLVRSWSETNVTVFDRGC